MDKVYSDDVDCQIFRNGEVLFIDHMISGDEAIKVVEIEMTHTRATDGIQVKYDLDRNGWVILQEKTLCKEFGSESQGWREVGFFPSWNLEERG